MNSTPAPLGDSHNFGRRVSVRGGRISKPRTLLWEWLALSSQSPLRRLLGAAAKRAGLGDAFGFLPSLAFSRNDVRSGGTVQRITLRPLGKLGAKDRAELAGIVGRSLALWSWLGVADLHWENLALGRDARGQIVFGPLDIELMLADLGLPTETKLLPDADPEYAVICQHACGVRRVLPYLGKPVAGRDLLAMAGSYRSTLALLDEHSAAIAEVFANLEGLRQAPLRVLLRGTDEYVRARSEPLWPPLLDAEAEQLARGDIPYFFRLYGRPGIHYFADPSLETVRRLPLTGDVPKLDPILQLARGLRSPSRQKLREDGLFTLVGAFDHPALSGEHESPELGLSLGKRSIILRLPSGEELESRRDLRSYVSSVYLPCRCGEVRSVLVPPRSACETERSVLVPPASKCEAAPS